MEEFASRHGLAGKILRLVNIENIENTQCGDAGVGLGWGTVRYLTTPG